MDGGMHKEQWIKNVLNRATLSSHLPHSLLHCITLLNSFFHHMQTVYPLLPYPFMLQKHVLQEHLSLHTNNRKHVITARFSQEHQKSIYEEWSCTLCTSNTSKCGNAKQGETFPLHIGMKENPFDISPSPFRNWCIFLSLPEVRIICQKGCMNKQIKLFLVVSLPQNWYVWLSLSFLFEQ